MNRLSDYEYYTCLIRFGCAYVTWPRLNDAIRWDEKAGLRRDAVRSQVINVLEAQEKKETGNEEG